MSKSTAILFSIDTIFISIENKTVLQFASETYRIAKKMTLTNKLLKVEWGSNMKFKNLEQRIAQGYIDTFPAFIPDKNAPVSVQEQKQFYDIMKDLRRLAFEEPLLFVPTLHDDDAFPNRFNKRSYGKPELQKTMQKFTTAVDSLLQNMFLLGQGGEIQISHRQQTVLSKVDVDDVSNLPVAWKWMAKREGANFVTFSHCLFDKDYPYASGIYANLFGKDAFHNLEDWMISQGYKRYDVYSISSRDCRLPLTYANPAWGEGHPDGGFEYRIKHTGISVRYESSIEKPAVFGLCVPRGLMKTLTESFDTMSESLKAFIVKQNTKCRGCRYCLQTDKTGLRPLAYTVIEYGKTKHKLCEYFPGHSYYWTSIDDELADALIEMLSFMDKFAHSCRRGAVRGEL